MSHLQNNSIHIVSFDVPFPANYGGVIDVFYKIKYLASIGCNIYLHCFEYGRGQQNELEKYCKQVWYYKRKTLINGISLSLPYIVYSRRDRQLLERLAEIDAPILFEGIHSTYYLSHPVLKNRFKAIRIHNIEHDYYFQLFKKESSILKKIFFKIESILLKKYEKKLSDAQAFFALSVADSDYYQKQYPKAKHKFIAPFHGSNEVNILLGIGSYCLYHGNLSHPENKDAVLYLLNNIIVHVKSQVIIAGKKPGKEIMQLCKKISNCKLIQNPNAEEIEQLVQNAQVHILPTFQETGIKLKLLNALFRGRHVVVNQSMLYGTGLNNICEIANDTDDFINKINAILNRPFTESEIQNRIEMLKPFSNYSNALLLKQLMMYSLI